MRALLARPCPSRSSLAALFLTLAAAACSSSAKKSNPDAQPYVNPTTDANIVNPPDTAGLDASSEFQEEAGQASRLTVSPAGIDLGGIQPGTQAPRQTITVTAVSDLSDLTVRLLGDELTLAGTSTCGKSLSAGTSCFVVITFQTTTTGAKSDSVIIVAGGQSTVVPVTAKVQIGGRLVISPASPQPFVSAVGQSSAPITFEVANAGDTEVGPVTAKIAGTNAADFTATAMGCNLLAPGATCTIAVVFTQKAATATSETATLVVTGPAPDFLTASVTLSGACFGRCGPGPALILTPASGDLGSIAVATTGPAVTFTLTNSGSTANGPFTVALSNSEFVITDETCSTSLLPSGGACTISVSLKPTSAGDKTATLTVTSPSGTPAVKTLTGTATMSLDGGLGGPVDAGQEQGEAGSIALDGSSG
jgi:hypothetical protein